MSAPSDQIARLRLIRSDNIGPVTYFQLLARFGSAEAALAAIPDLAARGGGRAPPHAAQADERLTPLAELRSSKRAFVVPSRPQPETVGVGLAPAGRNGLSPLVLPS